LSPLLKVVSAEPVLKPEVVTVIRAVADHYAGTFSDVVRLAVPPRHGLTEKADPPTYPAPTLPATDSVCVARYPHGPSLLSALQQGRPARASLALAPVAQPVGDWVRAMIESASATLAGGRGALLLVPDAGDLARLENACVTRFGKGSFVTLTAEEGRRPATGRSSRSLAGRSSWCSVPVQRLSLPYQTWDWSRSTTTVTTPGPNRGRPIRMRGWWPPCDRACSRARCSSSGMPAVPRPRRWSSGVG